MPFSVNIQVASSTAEASVQAIPGGPQPISAAEATAFGLDEGNLKILWKALKQADPDDVRLADPCRSDAYWYRENGKPPVQTSYRIISAKVVGVNVVDAAVVSEKLTNDTHQTAFFKPTLSTSTTNTVSSSTTATNSVGMSQTINYGINFLGVGAGGSTILNYSNTWADEKTKSLDNKFELTASASIGVPPGETVIADMILQKGTMEVQIVYHLSVSGWSEANFDHRVDDHFIWFYDVNVVLENSSKPTDIEVTETITIGFYANASIIFRDGAGRALRAPVSSGHSPSGVF